MLFEDFLQYKFHDFQCMWFSIVLLFMSCFKNVWSSKLALSAYNLLKSINFLTLPHTGTLWQKPTVQVGPRLLGWVQLLLKSEYILIHYFLRSLNLFSQCAIIVQKIGHKTKQQFSHALEETVPWLTHSCQEVFIVSYKIIAKIWCLTLSHVVVSSDSFPFGNKLPPTNVAVSDIGPVPR